MTLNPTEIPSSAASPTHDARRFRNALGSFATGVTIVTTRTEGRDAGLTVNSFSSVSLDPPMVLWSLARTSLSLPAFLNSEYFAVHVLSAAQETLSGNFANRGSDKFASLAVTRGLGEVPLLPDCAARFQCRTVYRYEGGDHVIFVGQVLAYDQQDVPPLLFHGGRYAIAAPKMNHLAAPGVGFSNDFLIYLLSRAHQQLFLQLQHSLQAHGLAESDWFCLGILSTEGPLSIAELDRRMAYTGIEVTFDRVAGLAAAELVQLAGGHDPGTQITLTERGHTAVIELIAAAKAAEADAESRLGGDESRLLKEWLRMLIAGTPSAAPNAARDD